MSDYGYIYSFLKDQLFVQYCCTNYCSLLWPFSAGGLDSQDVDWRKTLRVKLRIHRMIHCDIISAMAGKPLLVDLKSRFVKLFNNCMSCENDVVKTITFVCISNPMSCTGNNYKLLLNDQNESGVLDMIEWKMKYTEWIDNVYVLKTMINVQDGFKECVGFNVLHNRRLLSEFKKKYFLNFYH